MISLFRILPRSLTLLERLPRFLSSLDILNCGPLARLGRVCDFQLSNTASKRSDVAFLQIGIHDSGDASLFA